MRNELLIADKAEMKNYDDLTVYLLETLKLYKREGTHVIVLNKLSNLQETSERTCSNLNTKSQTGKARRREEEGFCWNLIY